MKLRVQGELSVRERRQEEGRDTRERERARAQRWRVTGQRTNRREAARDERKEEGVVSSLRK